MQDLFRIELIRPTHKNAMLGSITINSAKGDFQEFFYASLSYWTEQAYIRQWRDALERVYYMEEPAALITDMHDPVDRECLINWWKLYPEGDMVYMYNQLLYLAIWPTFSEKDPYKIMQPRSSFNEDGVKLSEWIIQRKAIEAGYHKLW